MKVLFTIAEGMGLLLILFGIGSVESASLVPEIAMAVGSILVFAGYKGEQMYVSY